MKNCNFTLIVVHKKSRYNSADKEMTQNRNTDHVLRLLQENDTNNNNSLTALPEPTILLKISEIKEMKRMMN